jgi:hypothetical protein
MILRMVRRRARAVVAGSAMLATACGGGPATSDLSRLRAEHERLRGEFSRLADHDPVVTEALAQGGDVILGIRPALVEGVLREVASRYLDRVLLDLPLEKQVRDSGELKLGTFLGRLKAGTWTLDVTIHSVHGMLRARPPHVASAPGNMLALEIPVVLEEGHGTATVRFTWDSHSVASVLCRDFEVTKRLAGEVLAREYRVSGAFQLSAGPEALRLEPRFPRREFRIQVDLTDRSWAQVQAAIEEQDEILRCGLALDPDSLLARLRARLHEGFDVKLPRSLFRPVDFPAAVRQEATIEDHRVDLAVKTRALTITPVSVWYGADVRTRIEAEPSEAAPPAAPPR